MEDWQIALGRPLGAEDQPPGFYRFRSAKGCPWQPLRLLFDGNLFHVLLNGQPVKGSPAADPMLVPLWLWRCPFHAITEAEYDALRRAYDNAPAGHPLRTPDVPVDVRAADPLRSK